MPTCFATVHMFQLLVVSVGLKFLIICAGVQTTVEGWRNGNFSRPWTRKIFLSFYFTVTQIVVELRWSTVGSGRIFLRLQETLWDDCLLEMRSDTKLWLMPKFSWGLQSSRLAFPISTSTAHSPISASTDAYQSTELSASLRNWSVLAFICSVHTPIFAEPE